MLRDKLPTTKIEETRYPGGQLEQRTHCKLSDDGTRWLRHGPCTVHHRNGAVLSEGHFVHDLEAGLWLDYHPNGQRAAEGRYENGEKVGVWRFWDENGREETPHDWAAPPSGD
jgi:antitoxin component YwqK of YwqJK toxin-antitoxin module